MAHGSACVVWHKDADGIVHVLMGVESRYLTDYMDTLEFRELNEHLRGDRDAGKKPGAISARTEELHLHATPGCYHRDAQNRKIFNPRIPLAEFQKIPVAHCSLEHSKPIFERRAKALQGLIGPRVQYDTPVVDSGNHTVNFRIVVDPTTLHSLEVHSERTGGFTLKPNVRGHMSSFGILKGRKNEGETFEAAMARELAEESGTHVGGGVALTAIGERGLNHFFALELTAGQKETWQTHIASRLTRNSGELFNVGWVPCFDAGMNVMRPLRPLDSGTTPSSLLVRVDDRVEMNRVSQNALELFRDACLSGRIPGCMPLVPAAAVPAAAVAVAVAPFNAPLSHYQHGQPRSQYPSQYGHPRSQYPSQYGSPRSQYPSQYGSPRSSHRSSQHDSRSHHGQHRGVNKPPHKGHRGGKTRKTNKKTFKRRK